VVPYAVTGNKLSSSIECIEKSLRPTAVCYVGGFVSRYKYMNGVINK